MRIILILYIILNIIDITCYIKVYIIYKLILILNVCLVKVVLI